MTPVHSPQIRAPRLAAAAVLAAFLGWAAGCARPTPPPVATKPPQVMVERPTVHSVTDYEEFTGHTEAFKKVEVRAAVSGYLDAVLFKDGEFVEEGRPLFQIDRRVYAAQKASAKAAVEKARADLAFAEASLRRTETGRTGGAIGQEEYDRAVAARDGAKANLDAAVANQELAETNLGYTTITARYSGRLDRRTVDPGNYVQSNNGNTASPPLTTLVVLDPIYATFEIDERTLLRIRRLIAEGRIRSAREGGLAVLVGVADQEGFPMRGDVDFAANVVDPTTGTLTVRAEMKNPTIQSGVLSAVVGPAAAEDANRRGSKLLSPGMFIRIRLPIGAAHDALMIPEEALGSDQGAKFVFVVDDKDVVTQRTVKVGTQEGRLRVIEGGLAATDRVVVNGLQRVRPGAKVAPVDAPPPKAAPPAKP